MSYTNGGIFHEGGEGMPSPLVTARSEYPSRFHGSTFFQPQSVPVYRENPMYVPGLGADAAPSPGCGCGGFKSVNSVGWYDINRADSFGEGPSMGVRLMGGFWGAVIGGIVGVAFGGVAAGQVKDRDSAAGNKLAGNIAVGGLAIGVLVGAWLGGKTLPDSASA